MCPLPRSGCIEGGQCFFVFCLGRERFLKKTRNTTKKTIQYKKEYKYFFKTCFFYEKTLKKVFLKF